MFIRINFVLLCLVFAIECSVIPNTASEEACADLGDICRQLVNYCDSNPRIKELCPHTCGLCEGPCTVNNGGCNHYCSGSTEPVCTCRDGYQLGYDQKTCIDINECASKIDPCDEESFCVNTPGSFFCQTTDCRSMGNGLENYYKSGKCCQDHVPFNDKLKEDQSEFERLLNGNEAETQWPWMVQIIKIDEHLCGGVLIAKNWVATSTLCIQSIESDALKVVLGDVRNAEIISTTKSSSVERKVMKVISHPDLSKNDITLLQLNEPVQYNELIQPVSLPCGETPEEGDTCYVTGYGYKDEKSLSSSEILKEIALPTVSSAYCELAYGKTSTVFDSQTMMCAGHIGGGEDACYGDGGSPLVCQRKNSCQWYLSGLVSKGKGCGRIGYPGIYTNVGYFEKWIRNIVGNELPTCQS